MLGSINDVWAYSTLGMMAESFEDEVDSLRKRSFVEPVRREDVDGLLSKYNVKFENLPTWLHAKVGEIEIQG